MCKRNWLPVLGSYALSQGGAKRSWNSEPRETDKDRPQKKQYSFKVTWEEKHRKTTESLELEQERVELKVWGFSTGELNY